MVPVMDLRLASTYVPVLICAAKSAVIAMLAHALVPSGCASVLALAVAIDRRLMFMLPPPAPGSGIHQQGVSSNPYLVMQHHQVMLMAITTGFDINAIQAFVLAASVACNERREHAMLQMGAQWAQSAATAVLGLWMLLGVALTVRPGLIAAHKEIVLLSLLFVALMTTHDGSSIKPGEDNSNNDNNEVAWSGVRAVYLVACASVSVYTSQSDALLPLLMRMAPIMLAPFTPALCFAALVLGLTLLRWHRLAVHSQQAGLPLTTASSSAGPDAMNNNSNMADHAESRNDNSYSNYHSSSGGYTDFGGGGSHHHHHHNPYPQSLLDDYPGRMTTTVIPTRASLPSALLLPATSIDSVASAILMPNPAASEEGILIGGAGPGQIYSDFTGNEQAQLREAIARQKGLRSQ